MTTTPRLAAHGTPRPVLDAVRELLDGADEALLCSAFVDTRGLQLIGRELKALGDRGRLVATMAFSGDRARAAMTLASEHGTRCAALTPSRGTFHPKVIVARHGNESHAMVGSANLTSGLVVNVEAGLIVGGDVVDEVSALAESWWDAAIPHVAGALPTIDVLEDDLWQVLRVALQPGDVVMTLGSSPRPNTVVSVERHGLLVETESSKAKGIGPQLIEPRMLQLAWDVLVADGALSNRRLLDELRVHRSSAVCAILARLPGVEVTSRSPIRLGWAGHQLAIAAEPNAPEYD